MPSAPIAGVTLTSIRTPSSMLKKCAVSVDLVTMISVDVVASLFKSLWGSCQLQRVSEKWWCGTNANRTASRLLNYNKAA